MLFETSNKIRVNLRFYWIVNFVKNKFSKRASINASLQKGSFINDIIIFQGGMGSKVRKS